MLVFQLISKWLSVEELLSLECTCKNMKEDPAIWLHHYFGQKNFKKMKYRLLSEKSIRDSLISYYHWKKFSSLPFNHIIEYLYEVKKIRDFLLTCYVYNSNIILELYKRLNKMSIERGNQYQRRQLLRWKMNIIILMNKRKKKIPRNKQSVFKRTYTNKNIYVDKDKMFDKRIECFS